MNCGWIIHPASPNKSPGWTLEPYRATQWRRDGGALESTSSSILPSAATAGATTSCSFSFVFTATASRFAAESLDHVGAVVIRGAAS